MKESKKVVSAEKVSASYEVHFGTYIPKMRKTYTKQELENDPDACAYLVEIGSQAVTELITTKNNDNGNI